MVKRFFRFSISSIILQIITLLFISGCLYFAVLSTKELFSEIMNEKYETIDIVVTSIFYLGALLFIYVELTFLFGNICLNSDNISVHSDIKFGREKIQYLASINYVDIKHIEILPLRKNSKNQAVFLLRPIPYMILTNKNGKKTRFGLHLMSKKSVKLLLEELLKKCEEKDGINFDVEGLFRDFTTANFKG